LQSWLPLSNVVPQRLALEIRLPCLLTKTGHVMLRFAPLLLLACTCCAPETRRAAPEPGGVLVASSAGLDYLAALDALDRVRAYPVQARDYALGVPESFYERELPSFFRFDAERVFALRPELVILSPHQSAQTRKRLSERQQRLLVLREVRQLSDIEQNLEDIANALRIRSGSALEGLRAGYQKLRARARQALGEKPPLVLSFSDFGSGIWTAGKHTVLDLQLELAGARNLARELGLEGHVKVEPERLLQQQPDVLLCTGRGARAAIAGSAVLSRLRCVQEGRVLELPARLLAANTPQILQGAERLQAELSRMRVGASVHAERR
jgi:ABC-type Fe3+-hydroxamate transport system substrate-binding protein